MTASGSTMPKQCKSVIEMYWVTNCDSFRHTDGDILELARVRGRFIHYRHPPLQPSRSSSVTIGSAPIRYEKRALANES